MLVTLPVVGLILLIVLVNSRYSDLRVSLLAASTIWGLIIVFLTEVLSMVSGITYIVLAISWGSVDFALLCGVLYLYPNLKFERIKNWLQFFQPISLIFPLICIGLVEAFIALQAPPNTWDSMTYHMSRVVHWIQNSDVSFYSTNILRQNHQSPFSEWAILHLQILSQGDHFANLIQWSCMLGSVIGVSLITRVLGGNRYLQVVSAVFCSTIPMGILQASSTQNDYVVSFWLVCAIYFFMRSNSDHSYVSVFLTGAAIGLALLTKGTGYIFVLPFLLVESVFLIYRYPNKAMKSLAVISGVVILLNFGHYMRNFNLYGNLLGPGREADGQFKYANDEFSLPILGSNLIRNVGLHISTPSNRINEKVESALYFLLGTEVNNPKSTWGGSTFQIPSLSRHEDGAGNPLHLLLIVVSVSVVVLSVKFTKRHRVYVACLLAASILFCGYLRWQPWHSRLHLPLFVLFSPMVALGVSNVFRTDRSMRVFSGFLIMASVPWIALNSSRPLVGTRNVVNTPRVQQIFVNNPSLMKPYSEAVGAVVRNGDRNIGLSCGLNDWEYPIHVFLHEHYGSDYRIEHVDVNNVSSRLSGEDFFPTAIIATKAFPDEMGVGSAVYEKVYENQGVVVGILNPDD